MSTSSYVDPGFAKTTYSDIKPVAEKYHIALHVQHLKNGEAVEQGLQQTRSLVESTLWTSGIFDFNNNASTASLTVIIDNVSEKSATAKGFASAASFGAIGAKVTDYYSFAVKYVSPASEQWQSDYKHALHTVVGNKKPPVDLQPTTPALGFATIVEQVLLNAVSDMQSQGVLSHQ